MSRDLHLGMTYLRKIDMISSQPVSAGAAELAALGHLIVPPLSKSTARSGQFHRLLRELPEPYHHSFEASYALWSLLYVSCGLSRPMSPGALLLQA